jgi:ComF family protein
MDEKTQFAWRRLRLQAFYPAQWLARSAADLFFPPACPGCGRLTLRHGGLCSSCWRDMRFIEKPYCDVLGSPFSYDLGPGALSAEAIANPPDFDRLRSVCHFDGVGRNLIHALKYKDRTELAPMMALWMARAGADLLADCDAVLPVPLHPMRMLARRFNQAAELAHNVARQTGKPMLASTLYRKRNTAHQVGLTKKGREANVRGAFRLAGDMQGAIFGARLVLIDDVYTTGATVSAIARLLKRNGAARVSVLTFARALPHTI